MARLSFIVKAARGRAAAETPESGSADQRHRGAICRRNHGEIPPRERFATEKRRFSDCGLTRRVLYFDQQSDMQFQEDAMIFKFLTAATFAVALAAFPAEEARADAGDVVGGLIVGGLIGAAIANDQNGRRNTAGNSRGSSSYQGIPATQVGRDTQTALNYFGFNAGAVDGQIGTGTRGAIERFQMVMGYPINGRNYPSYQYDSLMQAYYWGLNGGSAQTGLVGQPLLMAYRDAQAAPQQPQVVVVPQPAQQGQPAQQVVAQPPAVTTVVPAPAPAQDNK